MIHVFQTVCRNNLLLYFCVYSLLHCYSITAKSDNFPLNNNPFAPPPYSLSVHSADFPIVCVQIFHHLVRQDHLENQGDMPYLTDRMVNIMIRRNYLYEDAYEKLSPENGEGGSRI